MLKKLNKLVTSVKGFFVKSLAWLKKNYKGILIALSSLVILLGLLRFKKQAPEYAIEMRKLDLVKDKQEIEQLKAQKAALSVDRKVNEVKLQELDERIKSADKDIVNSKKEISHLSIDEKLKRFEDLGYK